MVVRFTSFRFQLTAALAAVAAFHAAWRPVTYKLADMVLVHADAAGFAERASEHPWGVVDWTVRLLAATDLTWWGMFVQLALVAAAGTLAYRAARRLCPKSAPFAPWIAAAVYIVPTLLQGEGIWLLRYPQFAQMHLVWLAILAGFLCLGRKGLVGFAALNLALVVAGRCLYHDLSSAETLKSAWNLPVGLEFPARDTRDQLRMERAVQEGRFADVLEIASDKAKPRRMETAWRILALFRTDALEGDLSRVTAVDSYRDTEEQEMVMEGPLMLFHYGLVLPARRWTFECAMTNGWHPQHFRLLGDCAIVTGEIELARKNYEEFARFPFRGDFARRRLAALKAETPPADAFADLASVRDFFPVWRDFAALPGAPRFYGDESNVERFVYGLFAQLPNGPAPMLGMKSAIGRLK